MGPYSPTRLRWGADCGRPYRSQAWRPSSADGTPTEAGNPPWDARGPAPHQAKRGSWLPHPAGALLRAAACLQTKSLSFVPSTWLWKWYQNILRMKGACSNSYGKYCFRRCCSPPKRTLKINSPHLPPPYHSQIERFKFFLVPQKITQKFYSDPTSQHFTRHFLFTTDSSRMSPDALQTMGVCSLPEQEAKPGQGWQPQ